ncbi:4-alpha-glucanotransferase [Marinobacter sp.]|uniref:4-alpha-glucanotransferase n=1 Tax=Marinobacter sp. TaxID=50741 RepID=UPI00356436DC
MTERFPAIEVFNRRRAGVLLHPTALPGTNGKLGLSARQFVDFLADAGMTVWQVLPTGPTHQDLSPYQSLSAHAGNPALIDLSELIESGLVTQESPGEPRSLLLAKAAERLINGQYTATPQLNPGTWKQFVSDHANWLENYALFMAIRESFPGSVWTEWPRDLRLRSPSALTEFATQNKNALERFRVEQFLFHIQWQVLRQYARDREVLLFGDIPIFVAHDSADVWANPELFKLDGEGQPTVVAGVPPDYFSPDGQYWGNPVYDWTAMAADGYQWWISRLKCQRELFDLLRIDHFRGLQAYWEIPADKPKAVNGYWVPGPGEAFLKVCFEKLPDLPLVAENLGLIGEDVEQLRYRFRLPGMTVIQFGFDGSPANPHLLRNHQEHDLVYTGTHDNDTTLGWYQSLDEPTRNLVNQEFNISEADIASQPLPIIKAAMSSVSRLVIVPMQDLLGLGSEARFNTPGTTENNWIWQLPSHYWERVSASGIREIVTSNGR